MTFQQFVRYHMPALEADEVRFNVQIAVMAAAAKDFPAGFQYWTLGAPGHCAFRSPDRSILLAELDRNECQCLACETKNVSCPGVLGSDNTAVWFAEEASLSDITFQAIEQQRIHALTESPLYPGAEGAARLVTAADAQPSFATLSPR